MLFKAIAFMIGGLAIGDLIFLVGCFCGSGATSVRLCCANKPAAPRRSTTPAAAARFAINPELATAINKREEER